MSASSGEQRCGRGRGPGGRRSWRAVVAAVIWVLAVGCVEMEQEITLTRKNGGAFRLAMSVPAHVQRNFLAPGSAPPAVARWFDPAQGAAALSEAAGFAVTRYRVYERDGRVYVRVEGKLLDAAKALASGRLGAFTLEDCGGGLHRLRWTGGTMRPVGDDQLRRRQQAAAGLKLKLTIRAPREIVATTGRKRDVRTAEWVFDVDADGSFLAAPPAISLDYR